MTYYRTAQEQMSDILAFGMSLMFVGLMLGLVKSLLLRELKPEKESPALLPRTSEEVSAKRYGVWDSYLDPGAAYAEAHRLRQKGWPVRVTERSVAEGKRYYVWIGRKEMPPKILPQAILIEGGERVPPQYRGLIDWISEPLPEYSLLTAPQLLPAVEAEVKERRIDAVLKQLKDGVETIQQSERFRLFLVTMSKFHDYSIGNQILIMIQKPDATRVAGFNTWKDLGRWVRKGEKGIAILAPVMPPKPKPEEKEEEEELEEIELRPVYFKVVYVFDIAQTEGKPLPEFDVPVLTGEANEELFTGLLSLMESQSILVSFEPRSYLTPEIKGQYLPPNQIWVRPAEPRAQQLKTLLHEVAHHYSEGVFRIPRKDAETIAESAAFVVGAHFSFDTGVRSFPYVALWAQDKKVLEQNLTAIRRVATTIIEALGE